MTVKPNWFIALPVSAERWFDALEIPDGFERTHRDDLHVTVSFLGSVGEAIAQEAWLALRWEIGAIDVSLGEVIALGDPSRYSALSALLHDGRAAVESAIAEARASLSGVAGIAVDRYAPKAHVTLCRSTPRAGDEERARAALWARGLELGAVRCSLDRIALFTRSDAGVARDYREVASRSTATR